MQSLFRFGPFTLNVSTRKLTGSEGPVRLREQSLSVLIFLIERAPEVVSRDELLTQVWGHDQRSESSVAQSIKDIRAALDDPARDPKYIITRYGQGYQFAAPVESVTQPETKTSRPLLWLAGLAAALSLIWAFQPEQSVDAGKPRQTLVIKAAETEGLTREFTRLLSGIVFERFGMDALRITDDAQEADAVISLSDEETEGGGGSRFLLRVTGRNGTTSAAVTGTVDEVLMASLDDIYKRMELDESVQTAANTVPANAYALESYLRGMAEFHSGDYRAAKKMHEAALESDPSFEIARYELANCLRRLGQPEQALAIYQAIEQRLPSDYWQVFIHSGRGLTYWRLGRLEEARADLEEALALAQTDKQSVIYLTNLGLVARDQGNLDEALDFGMRSLILARSLNEPALLASNLNTLAGIEIRRGDHKQALVYLDEARGLYYQAGNRTSYASVVSRSASAHRALGNFDQAEEYWNLALGVREELGDTRRAAWTRSDLAGLKRLRGQFDEALAMAQKSLDGAIEAGSDSATFDAYAELTRIASARKRFADADIALAQVHRLAQAGESDRDRVQAHLLEYELTLETESRTGPDEAALLDLLAMARQTGDERLVQTARVLQARFANLNGRPQAARSLCAEIVEADPVRSARIECGLLLAESFMETDPRAALDALSAIEPLNPLPYPYLRIKAATLLAAGQPERAMEAIIEAENTSGDWWSNQDQALRDAIASAQALRTEE